ncbi:hypothetical protein L6452_16583 [Arctium lappa]|uniref:Uncharacterized protein n=1 Tax=Arctium lappa TaxID=4217 RepID=A0ACB9C187_ARCLA|nr:hypothetical protein L6452_16583 [Arctium lappa]
MVQITRRVAITRENLPPRFSTPTTYKYVKAYLCIVTCTLPVKSCTFCSYIYPRFEKIQSQTRQRKPLRIPHIFKTPFLFLSLHIDVSGVRFCLSPFLRRVFRHRG